MNGSLRDSHELMSDGTKLHRCINIWRQWSAALLITAYLNVFPQNTTLFNIIYLHIFLQLFKSVCGTIRSWEKD